MNGRRFLLNCLAVVLVSLPLRGASGATLPSNIRTTTNGASARPQIVPHIEKLVNGLKADDVKAREQIIDEVLPSGAPTVTPSAAFLDVYADVLNTELLKIANDPNPRVRLNVAIAAAKVAEKANNPRLIPTIIDVLDDPNEGVVSWGLKAAKGVIGPAHTNAAGVQGSKLMPALAAAAKKHVASGPMTQAAYDSLKVVDVANMPAPAVKSAIDVAHELLKARRDLYIKGPPEFPSIENSVISFLSAQRIWKAQTPPQQLQTVQLILDMSSLVAQRYGAGGTFERQELGKMLETNGKALQVIGVWTVTETKMDAFAKPLSQVGATTPPDHVLERVKAVYTGLTGYTAWKGLTPPPTIQP